MDEDENTIDLLINAAESDEKALPSVFKCNGIPKAILRGLNGQQPDYRLLDANKLVWCVNWCALCVFRGDFYAARKYFEQYREIANGIREAFGNGGERANH